MGDIIALICDTIEENTVPAGSYFTVKAWAEKYGINESTVRSWISRGRIPSYSLNGQRLIPMNFKPKK